MKNSIQLSDFDFQRKAQGTYCVTYTSPVSGKSWSTTVNDMTLIDATKNADTPKKYALEDLKYICKNT
jgi:hypothetical protein